MHSSVSSKITAADKNRGAVCFSPLDLHVGAEHCLRERTRQQHPYIFRNPSEAFNSHSHSQIVESAYTMAPSALPRALFEEFVADASASHHILAARSLKVNTAQSVTLGIIAVYVVVIALLWNIPYVRMVLWPFKVRLQTLKQHAKNDS
jgi:uncharacterized membrane protein